ncbi:MAG: DUF1761 domain-containing protein [Candidatus Diapherotrites archaeon]|nr:DUF1761 domain-containing protein [Candidatus Diapherotrites archaeon]
MIPLPVNWVAVIVAAIAAQVIGYLWYSQGVFGKDWMKELGISPKEMKKEMKGMEATMIKGFLGSLIMAYILAQFLLHTLAVSLADGMLTAFWAWLGFIAVVMYGGVLWEKKSEKWFWMSSLYYLVSLLVMAIILVSL